MVAVRVTGRPSFSILGQERLFSATGYFSSAWGQVYDVAPDDRRFLMLRTGSSSMAAAVSLVLVQGFLTELERKVP